MAKLHKIWIILIAFPLVLTQCAKPKEAAINCVNTISFTQDIIPILRTDCAISGCHTGTRPTGGLNLDSARAYDQLTTDGYVHAGQAANSILYKQMTGVGGVPIMPPTGQLDHTLTDKIYCWIQQGALNN